MNNNKTWFDINSQDDIDTLLNKYYCFHDSCIVSAQYISGASVNDKGDMSRIGDNCLIIQFDSQMPKFHKSPENKTIELKFFGVRRLNLIGIQDNCFCDISDCYLAFYKNCIVWADTDYFNPIEYSENELLAEYMDTFVVADRLSWRFVK